MNSSQGRGVRLLQESCLLEVAAPADITPAPPLIIRRVSPRLTYLAQTLLPVAPCLPVADIIVWVRRPFHIRSPRHVVRFGE